MTTNQEKCYLKIRKFMANLFEKRPNHLHRVNHYMVRQHAYTIADNISDVITNEFLKGKNPINLNGYWWDRRDCPITKNHIGQFDETLALFSFKTHPLTKTSSNTQIVVRVFDKNDRLSQEFIQKSIINKTGLTSFIKPKITLSIIDTGTADVGKISDINIPVKLPVPGYEMKFVVQLAKILSSQMFINQNDYLLDQTQVGSGMRYDCVCGRQNFYDYRWFINNTSLPLIF
jgi:hypothetical protein